MSGHARGKGRVADRQHDGRVGRGAETCERLQAAYLAHVERGIFRPTLGQIEGLSDVPASTIKNYYPRLSLLGAVVADRVPLLVLQALGLPALKVARLSRNDQHAVAYALLVGERFDRNSRPSPGRNSRPSPVPKFPAIAGNVRGVNAR